jgi:predicted lipoprotein with Yx(FWY)xxD motif
MRILLRTIVLATGLLVIVAACSSSPAASSAAPPSEPPASEPAPVSEAPASEAPASEPPASEPPPSGTGLAVAESGLGQIVVDGAGLTLYGFTPDQGGTPTCYDGCAQAWPPLLGDDPAAVTVGAGLDASLLTTADRTDGGKQLLYNGWPLYYFANDSAAGDTNGQGVGGNWFVIAPNGDLIGQ